MNVDSRTHIRKQLFVNSGMMIACRIITAATLLISIPFVVNKLGVAGYGSWETMLAICTLGASFQGSINGTMLWKMSAAYGVKDIDEVRRLVRLGVATTLMICSIVSPAIWLLRYPLISILHIPLKFQHISVFILPCLGLVIVLGGINEIIAAVISGHQRTGLTTVIQSVSTMINYLAVIVGLIYGLGLLSLLLGYSLGALTYGIGLYAVSSKLCGRLNLLPKLPGKSDIKSMYGYSGLMMIGYISSALREQTDKLVLATFASAVWVGYYAIAYKLASLVIEISRFFYSPMLTAIGALHARGDWEGVKRLYSNMMMVVAIAAGSAAVLVAGLSHRLLVLWMGRFIPQVEPLQLLLITGYTCAVIITGPGTAVCRGIGRVGIETSYVAVNLVLNTAATIILVMQVGAIGTVIASGITWAISSVIFAFILHKKLDLPVAATRRSGLAVLAVIISVIAVKVVSYHIVNHHSIAMATTRAVAFIQIVFLGLGVLTLYMGLLIVFQVIPWASVRTFAKSLKPSRKVVLETP